MSRSEQKELQETRSIIALELPAAGDFPAGPIEVLKPIHPKKDLCIPLTASSLEIAINFLKHYIVDSADLAKKRSYDSETSDSGQKIHKMGAGRKAVKTESDLKYIKNEQS